MKLVTAVVRPSSVGDITDQLDCFGVFGFTVSEVRGCGHQKGRTEIYRGIEYRVDLVPKAKVEILVDDDGADELVDIIGKVVHTGAIGDGKVWLVPVETTVRIRTGERGTDVL